jgi:DNA replication and repair protein RecF
LLETIYVVAALRSFRTARLADLIAFDAAQATLAARVERGGVERVYELTIETGSRKVRLDGKAVRPVSKYFGDFNVVLFAPEDLMIPRGAPAERRRFLDRAVFNWRGDYMGLAADYEKVLKSRNALLRAVASGQRTARQVDPMLDVYDEQAARFGAAIVARRRAYLAELRPGFQAAFEAITRTGASVDAVYAAAPEVGEAADGDLEAVLGRLLAASRARDMARGATSPGPHRDDVAFTFAAHEAGSFASQGQLRALVLAWKTAEMDLLARIHGDPPILLLDDVSSELDPTRNRFLFEYLAQRDGQCFITTTHPDFVLLSEGRVDHTVQSGRILPS